MSDTKVTPELISEARLHAISILELELAAERARREKADALLREVNATERRNPKRMYTFIEQELLDRVDAYLKGKP